MLWLANYDERAMVRSTAWTALLDEDVAAGILRFFQSEWEYAESLAADVSARNTDFVKYIVDTCVPEYSPEVCAAAREAWIASPVEQEEFVRSGYGAAKDRDRRVRKEDGEQAAALVATDRAYVANLRDHDPGAQVKLAAAWALRAGADDGDLVEFFNHGWAYSAGLDVRAHRSEIAVREATWRREVARLTIEAQNAEEKARTAAGEALAQARATAARAWGGIAQNAGPAKVAWQDAERVALGQAEVWRQVAAAAAAAKTANWKPILDASGGISGQWAIDSRTAGEQATYWTDLYNKALAAERAWSKTPA
ncbi:hypothetical protein Q0Z83_098850 [Actinoplanes sichuanensis]|uniref:Uncharacterized protein n=1 Tax=Actinoplanes sichuanensis TaxID=512349 RepID=A0ABW4AI55_9ACTN|nr:hypothetical protein [Actinoplanes sichuanensis]BEL11694.1 hypothetical protein Q0Z83_098850 [Actinoplanes sichuanensis]